MDVDPSILVTLLNPLEANGYLSRERDAASGDGDDVPAAVIVRGF
jgi:hypothetical protein